jgi:hypothetical protein
MSSSSGIFNLPNTIDEINDTLQMLQQQLLEKEASYKKEIEQLQDKISDLKILRQHRLQKKEARQVSILNPEYVQVDEERSNLHEPPSLKEVNSNTASAATNTTATAPGIISTAVIASASSTKSSSVTVSNTTLTTTKSDASAATVSDTMSTNTTESSFAATSETQSSLQVQEKGSDEKTLAQELYEHISIDNGKMKMETQKNVQEMVDSFSSYDLNNIPSHLLNIENFVAADQGFFDRVDLVMQQDKLFDKQCIIFYIKDLQSRLLLNVPNEKIAFYYKKSNYLEYVGGSLANHNTIFSPWCIDTTGTKYRQMVQMDCSMLIAVTHAWNTTCSIYSTTSPWNLLLRLAIHGAFHNNVSGSALGKRHLLLLAEELNCEFLVTLSGKETESKILIENPKSNTKQSPVMLLLHLSGNHFLTGNEKHS